MMFDVVENEKKRRNNEIHVASINAIFHLSIGF